LVVRIPLKIENPSKGVVVKTSALINSGYEADKPEILIPHPLAGGWG